jgi:HAMP domain-containing protein
VAGPAKLSRKLLAGLAAGLGLASLAFLALFIEIYREQLSMERGSASEQVNRLLQVSLENAMLKRDLPGLQDIVGRLGQQPGITSVMIVNPQREVRFASNPDMLHRALSFNDLGCPECENNINRGFEPSTHLIKLSGGRDVLRSVNPIHNRVECKGCHGPAEAKPVNGILVVDYDASGIKSEAMRAAAAMSGAGLVVVLLGLGSVWFVLKKQVLSPIFALDRASRSLAGGHLETRVNLEPERDDEIADLFKSFNGMAGQCARAAQRHGAGYHFVGFRRDHPCAAFGIAER